MAQGRVRHLFPGGNTSLGFFSYYDHIITQEEANRIFIIKGGPGVGKSTFITKMGEKLQDRGYDLEHLHCSSDNDSLDGIVVPQLKVAFVDGTAPHIVDPKTPGAVDEILNFGEFWDQEGIHAHKNEIIKVRKETKYVFSRAYNYLKAAYTLYEGNAVIYAEALNKGQINQLTEELLYDLFDGEAAAAVEGKQRSMFASALTPNGYCNYLDTILTEEKIYEFKGALGTGEDRILEKIKTAAIERGYYVEAYYCALNPYKLDHLVIPERKCAFTTSNFYHNSTVKKFVSIDMNQYLNKDVLAHYQEDLQQNLTEFDHLMSAALFTIKRAKALHAQVENYYVPHIRFAEIDRYFEKILAKVLDFAEK